MSSANASTLSALLLYNQQKILQTISWIYITFGAIGCSLNILLLSQKQFRTISCCIYFLAASVAMLVHLLIYTVPSIYSIYHRNPLTYIVVYCKIRMFLIQATNLTYRWSYAVASFDRYALSSSNERLRRLASVPVAIRVLGVNMTIWVLFSIYILFLYTVQSDSCNIFNNTAATLFTSLNSIILGSIAPTLIMVVCTLLIRKNLKASRVHHQLVSNQQALKMLFAQIIVYAIVTIPWIAFSTNNLISPYISNKSADRSAIEGFISVVSGAFTFLFPAISFYVYMLTSKMFRDALIGMFKSLFSW